MGSRQWWGLVASLVLVSTCYGAMTAKAKAELQEKLNKMSTPELLKLQAQLKAKLARGGAADYQRGLAYFNRGMADLNRSDAFALGEGVPKNDTKAAYWGRKEEKDDMQAAYWWRKAAAQGDAHAEDGIGLFYYFGEGGMRKNYTKGVYWLRKAAEQGDVMAYSYLGDVYYHAKDVPENYVHAYKWFALAKAAALPGKPRDEARFLGGISGKLHKLASLMSPSQIARAQSLAAAWERARAAGGDH